MAGTVGQVLQSKGIEVGEHDVVAPAPSTTVVDGTRIAVQYGRQITVTVDGRPRTYWTTATNVDQALAALKLDLPGAQLSTSRSTSIGREGLAVRPRHAEDRSPSTTPAPSGGSRPRPGRSARPSRVPRSPSTPTTS